MTQRNTIGSMKLFRTAKFFALFTSLSLSYPLRSAEVQDEVCSIDPSSAVALVGTLTELNPNGAPAGWSRVTFQVSEILQGESAIAVGILMRNGLCEESGMTPVVGKSYLILTQVLSNSSLYQLEDCEQMRPIEQSTSPLAYLRNSKGGKTPSEISGEAVVEFRGYPWKRVPLPNTKIHLNGQNQTVDLTSDEDGRFHGAVSPGKYAVTAEFPTGYKSSAYSSHPPIIVVEHRCTRLTLGADPTASITAHIVDVEGDSLGPMSSVQLTLETAKDQQFVLSVWPDEKSNLKAENLLPGEYILGLNTYLSVNRGAAPYPPTYYPGVDTRSDAQVIVLGPGEQKVLSEMRIKKGQQCEIPVVVTDSSGKRSPSTVVGLAYRDYPHFYIQPGEQTDSNGRVAIYAVFPGPVFLRAEKDQGRGSTLESENLELSACPSQSVSLKLSHKVAQRPNASEK